MSRFWELNLIHFFNFYLGMMFLASVMARINQYRAVVGLVKEVPDRWPKLFQLIRMHGHIFLTWNTLLPAALALALFTLNMFASRQLWPHVDLTPSKLTDHWIALPFVLLFGISMLVVDAYSTFYVGEVDREMMRQYFDQAEYWLHSWTAPVVHVFTLGYVNPRQIVAVEVRKALLEASKMINSSLWWTTTQVGFRVAFGLSLWLTVAWRHS